MDKIAGYDEVEAHELRLRQRRLQNKLWRSRNGLHKSCNDEEVVAELGGIKARLAMMGRSGEEDALYVLQISHRKDLLKIGVSGDVYGRCHELQKCMPFWVTPVAIVYGAGRYEKAVHKVLEAQRVTMVPGREWFRCTLPEAMAGIAEAMKVQDEAMKVQDEAMKAQGGGCGVKACDCDDGCGGSAADSQELSCLEGSVSQFSS
jgi:hypothetical protein